MRMTCAFPPLRPLSRCYLLSKVRSVCLSSDGTKVLVGTLGSDILELATVEKPKGEEGEEEEEASTMGRQAYWNKMRASKSPSTETPTETENCEKCSASAKREVCVKRQVKAPGDIRKEVRCTVSPSLCIGACCFFFCLDRHRPTPRTEKRASQERSRPASAAC